MNASSETKPFKILKIRFRNEEDLKKFAELMGRKNITKKTKKIEFPLIEKDKITLF